MSKRLQVVLDDAELRRFQRIARRKGLSLSEWVRQTLRRAGRAEPSASAETKLLAVRAAVGHEYPAPDIDQMLAEIERGYVVEDRD